MASLTQLKQGINRLRTKGGANPESLYYFKNGYLTLAGTAKGRGGTVRRKTLPAGTKGLAVFASKLVTFHASSDTGADATVDIVILRHPEDVVTALAQIHFAEPFMGALYVVAEYANGDIYHFWLQAASEWEANKVYKVGDIVEPTTPNGYYYKAVRVDSPAQMWAPNVLRAVSDVVEPTTANGYKYTVIAVSGTNPASGATEPVWPTENGAVIVESTDTAPPVTATTSTGTGSTALPDDVVDRYEIYTGVIEAITGQQR